MGKPDNFGCEIELIFPPIRRGEGDLPDMPDGKSWRAGGEVCLSIT